MRTKMSVMGAVRGMWRVSFLMLVLATTPSSTTRSAFTVYLRRGGGRVLGSRYTTPNSATTGLSSMRACMSLRGGTERGGGSAEAAAAAKLSRQLSHVSEESVGPITHSGGHERAHHAEGGKGVTVYMDRVLGNGTFGVVYEGRLENGDIVAVKRVLQDPKFRNRELSIMRPLRHPNIVRLISFFYTCGSGAAAPNPSRDCAGEDGEEVFLNLVMEFVPETLYKCIKSMARQGAVLPPIEIKLYAWQLLRSLAYLHKRGVCHRDVKPQNLLVDPDTCIAKLCDMGSAKRLTPSSTSISYICSRFYRSPELILGATRYTTAVDMWSFGCVLGEALSGQPLFSGDTSVEQMAAIASIIGAPSEADIKDMCVGGSPADLRQTPSLQGFAGLDLGDGLGVGWKELKRSNTPSDAVSLLSEVLVYSPTRRMTAIECLAHPFFDELRDHAVSLPDGRPFPNVFALTSEEITWGKEQGLLQKILPSGTSFLHGEATPYTSPNMTPPQLSRGPSPQP